MNYPYPRGAARTIAECRANGLKPAETVLIVMAGTFDASNPLVYADPNQSYRWDWLRGLGVVVLINSKTRMRNTLQAIDQADPYQLDVIDIERRKGWQVLFTRPRLRTVRWPSAWVEDWLGAGEWHRELNQAKAVCAQRACRQQQETELHPEAVWN